MYKYRYCFCWTKAGWGDLIMNPLLVTKKPKAQNLNFLNEGQIKVIRPNYIN